MILTFQILKVFRRLDIFADWLQVLAADTPLVLTMAMAPATSESRALMIKAIREGFSEEMKIIETASPLRGLHLV